MIKKSDLQAAIDRLPDEFEDDALDNALGSLAYTPLQFTEEALQSIDDAEADFEAKGGIPLDDLKNEVAEWLASKSS